MERKSPEFRFIDLESWPRREHFRYYREKLKCSYSLTGRLDATCLVETAKKRGLRTYPCFLYVIAKTVNSMDEMKMMVTPDGAPGIWECVHLNFTVFHQEDKTFSDLWTEYDPSFDTFYQGFQDTVARYGGGRGVKLRTDQPPNFFCASCVPWMDYTGYSTNSVGDPAMFPIITFGKYTLAEGRYTLPVTVTISHAAADGYHTCQFFQRMQEELERFGEFV